MTTPMLEQVVEAAAGLTMMPSCSKSWLIASKMHRL